MKFTYSSGQRVLDSYTLKRGIGQGGFGEVYYAVSDGGKEVALKLVHSHNRDIELRGMAQCLNLKHPNLLDLYDLRTDEDGNHWVVMEYVAGDTLSTILNRHPHGLPKELAHQWFLDLAKAIGYLHDHGIVHRDLKPGNIFIENGIVKLGDYGLSKCISSSQRTAQTQSVGTVHYMAPEVSTGNYNKQIDIYAAGVIFYEMLTGRVPFDGESAGEILMKHLTSAPDLSPVPGEYVPIIAKALAKNPAHRYSSMAEMARDVEGSNNRPEPPRQAVPPSPARPRPNARQVQESILHALPAASLRVQVGELFGSMALSVLLALLLCTLWARFAALNGADALTRIGSGFFLTVAACWAVLIPSKFWQRRRNDSAYRRLVMLFVGLLLGLLALWLDGWSLVSWPKGRPFEFKNWSSPLLQTNEGFSNLAGYLSYFGLTFFSVRWWRMAERMRSSRVSLLPVMAASFWALILQLIWPDTRAAIALILASLIVQIVSPWAPPPPRAARPMRLRYA
ncbi:MAG: hypothetical protein KatS3mg105_2881 [Gemmatales bacterium]|nr:MAG: hypothetical protein KatS3mg105_2881 [Gemmatales bacterium]